MLSLMIRGMTRRGPWRLWGRCESSLSSIGAQVLNTPELKEKIAITQRAVLGFKDGSVTIGRCYLDSELPMYPARPPKPELVDRSKFVGPKSANEDFNVPLNAYILLSLAHIELTACDMYWDTLSRFGSSEGLPPAFAEDFLSVVSDEARHLDMVLGRLADLGYEYGCLPAHASLWELGVATRFDLAARLALVPLVQEARGLDAGPRFVKQLNGFRDKTSAKIVQTIVDEEVSHVKAGMKWFRFVADLSCTEPMTLFHELVKTHMPTGLFPPFNELARAAADMQVDWYKPLANTVRSPQKLAPTVSCTEFRKQHSVAARTSVVLPSTSPPKRAGGGDHRQFGTATCSSASLLSRATVPSSSLGSVRRRHHCSPSGARVRPRPWCMYMGIAASQHSTAAAPAATSGAASVPARTVVFCLFVWPQIRASAAGLHTIGLIRLYRSWGWRVVCVSPARVSEHTAELQALCSDTAEACTFQCSNNDEQAFADIVAPLTPSAFVFDRFTMEEQFAYFAQKMYPEAMRVLDTQDLHFVRLLRERMLENSAPEAGSSAAVPWTALSAPPLDVADAVMTRELTSLHRCDVVLVVSAWERQLLLCKFGFAEHKVVLAGFFYDVGKEAEQTKSWDKRTDICTIGCFTHRPNVDGLLWFKAHVWPLLRALVPSLRMHVYGSYPADCHMKLTDTADQFLVRGPVKDQFAALRRHRVLVAPLRYGAGIKGKITDAWRVGTPVVTTPMGSEGLNYHSSNYGEEHLVTGSGDWPGASCSSPQSFARAVALLCTSEDVWHHCSSLGPALVRQEHSVAVHGKQVEAALRDSFAHYRERRHTDWMQAMLWSNGLRTSEFFTKYVAVRRELAALKNQASQPPSQCEALA